MLTKELAIKIFGAMIASYILGWFKGAIFVIRLGRVE